MDYQLKSELTRNVTGYFLVVVGVAVIVLGAHMHVDSLTKTGEGLVAASMLAFQLKRGDTEK